MNLYKNEDQTGVGQRVDSGFLLGIAKFSFGMSHCSLQRIGRGLDSYGAGPIESAVCLSAGLCGYAEYIIPISKMTPHLCRKGCKHYDSVGDQKSAKFREFCWKSEESRIERDSVCGTG